MTSTVVVVVVGTTLLLIPIVWVPGGSACRSATQNVAKRHGSVTPLLDIVLPADNVSNYRSERKAVPSGTAPAIARSFVPTWITADWPLLRPATACRKLAH